MNITECRFHAHYVDVWSADSEWLNISFQKKKCKEFQEIETNKKTTIITYTRADGTYETKHYDVYSNY